MEDEYTKSLCPTCQGKWRGVFERAKLELMGMISDYPLARILLPVDRPDFQVEPEEA